MSYASHQLSSTSSIHSIVNQTKTMPCPTYFQPLLSTWFWLNRKIQISRMFFTSQTSFYFKDESSDESRYWVHEMGMKWIFQGCQTEASQSKSDMYRQKYSDMLNISIRQSVQSFRIVEPRKGDGQKCLLIGIWNLAVTMIMVKSLCKNKDLWAEFLLLCQIFFVKSKLWKANSIKECEVMECWRTHRWNKM